MLYDMEAIINRVYHISVSTRPIAWWLNDGGAAIVCRMGSSKTTNISMAWVLSGVASRIAPLLPNHTT